MVSSGVGLRKPWMSQNYCLCMAKLPCCDRRDRVNCGTLCYSTTYVYDVVIPFNHIAVIIVPFVNGSLLQRTSNLVRGNSPTICWTRSPLVSDLRRYSVPWCSGYSWVRWPGNVEPYSMYQCKNIAVDHLLTRINFDNSMDKQLHPIYCGMKLPIHS